MARHESSRKVLVLSAIAVASLIAFGLGPVFGDRAPTDKAAPQAVTVTLLPAHPGCWSNGKLPEILSLLSDEGGFSPAVSPEDSGAGGTERPPVRRTCRCSCGYPCTTSADCDGAPCTVGITCC